MALDVNKSITIDLVNKNYKVIDLVQNDSARSITFSLLLNGNKFNLTGLVIRAFSDTNYYKDLTIINATDGICKLKLDNQMINKAGDIELQLRISDGSVMVTSFIVILKVTKSLIYSSSIQSDNRIDALDKALNDVQVLNVKLQGASSDLEKKYTTRLTNAENNIVKLSTETYGAVNLLKETELKRNSTQLNVWTLSNCASITDELYSPHGNRCFRFFNDDDTSYYSVTQHIFLASNTTYVFGAWFRLDENAEDADSLLFQIAHLKPDGSTAWLNSKLPASELKKGQWIFAYRTFTTGNIKPNTSVSVSIQSSKSKWHGHFGDLWVSVGRHIFDWNPSFKDIVSQNIQYTDGQYAKAIAYTDEITKKAYINGKISSNFNLEAGTSYTFESLSTYINKNITNTLQCSLAGMYNVSAHISLYNRASSNEECLLEVKVLVNDTEASSTTHYVIFGPLTHTNVLVSTLANVTAGDSIKIKVTNREDSRGYTLDYTQSYINIYKI